MTWIPSFLLPTRCTTTAGCRPIAGRCRHIINHCMQQQSTFDFFWNNICYAVLKVSLFNSEGDPDWEYTSSPTPPAYRGKLITPAVPCDSDGDGEMAPC